MPYSFVHQFAIQRTQPNPHVEIKRLKSRLRALGLTNRHLCYRDEELKEKINSQISTYQKIIMKENIIQEIK